MMKDKSLKYGNNLLWSITIIVLLLLFLLMSCGEYGRIETLTPTGNIDIFDIIINCNCKECEKCGECDSEPSKPITPDVPGETVDNVDGLADVFDNIDSFENQEELKIFENYAFEVKNKIAPGSYNSYQFVVRNNNELNIKYIIGFNESNIHNINMKYRLKKNGEYILGDDKTWVTYSDLKVMNNHLEDNGKDVYSLDWKWFDSINDTNIGVNSASTIYKLIIGINAESVSV